MKNYQKNSRNPSVPFSCMIEQLMATVRTNIIMTFKPSHMEFEFEPRVQTNFI